MIAITIDRDAVTPTLNLMVDRMRDFSEPIAAILSDGLVSSQEVIVEGAFGRSWAPMAPATVRRGRDPGTLELDSGAMLLSLSKGGDGNLFEAGPTEGIAGTGLSGRGGFPYPYWQQQGTARYPARPFLFWHEERIPDYLTLFAQHIMPEGA